MSTRVDYLAPSLRHTPPAGHPLAAAVDAGVRVEDQHAHRLLPEVRTERLIAIGRLLLSVCGLLAVTIDPPPEFHYAGLASATLLAYTIYAAALLVTLRAAHARVLRLRVALHAVDVSVFAALLLMTGGSTSPFLSLIVVPVAVATLRWQDAGAIRTGAVVLAFFVVLQVYDYATVSPPLASGVVRLAVLAAVVLLLAELGRLDRRNHLQVMRVARWPAPVSGERMQATCELLTRAAATMGAARAVLALEHPEEPWIELVSWDGSEHGTDRLGHATTDGIVAAELIDSPFLWKRGSRMIVSLVGDQTHVHRGAPVASSLAPRLDGDSVLALPLRAGGVSGHIFLLDVADATADDLRVGEVLARHVASTLQQFVLTERMRAATAADERVRISRDLHDGVLQSLAGIALRLAAVRQSFASAPERAIEQMLEVEQLILDQQRELRFFTAELRLQSGSVADGDRFSQALSGLFERVSKVWGVQVEWDPADAAQVPPLLAWEAYQLLHEGIVNSARHGRATSVRVQLATTADFLRLGLSDNGSGFPFTGSYTMNDLVTQRRGPRSLRERVEALGGSMRIESGDSGAIVEVELPLAWGSP